MRPNGGWKSVGDVEVAVAEYIEWFNYRRVHGEIGLIPPVEFETNFWTIQPIIDQIQHYPQNPVLAEAGSK